MDQKNSIVSDSIVEGLVSLIPGIGPMLGPTGKKIADLLVGEHVRRISVAMRAAEELSTLKREELEEELVARPEAWPLLIRVLQMAGQNGHDHMLRVIGQSLARGLGDETRRFEEELLLVAIGDLLPVHFHVLKAVAERDDPETGMIPAEVQTSTGLTLPTVSAALAALLSHGLFQNPYSGYGGGEFYKENDLGEVALRAFAEAIVER
jgi:hypothetical protein